MKPNIKWTNDCQGKKDYDGELVYVSTRYWPRGGGFHILDEKGFRPSIETRPDLRPSAHSSIMLNTTEDYDDQPILAERDFEGDTEEEVKAAVEAWVAEQFAVLVTKARR